MRVAVPHNTSREIARKKVEQRIVQALSQYGNRADEVHHAWVGDTMSFKGKGAGMSVSGTVEVTDAAVIVDAKLPFLAKPFEGRIRETLERELAAAFA